MSRPREPEFFEEAPSEPTGTEIAVESGAEAVDDEQQNLAAPSEPFRRREHEGAIGAIVPVAAEPGGHGSHQVHDAALAIVGENHLWLVRIHGVV